MSTKIEYKAADVTGVQVEDEGNGIVTAIVSVTGIKDSVNDIIEPGAYKDTLVKRQPKGIWHHDWHQPVSKTLDARELMPLDPDLPKTLADGVTPWPPEAGALKVKQQFNLNTDRGRTAYEDVKFFGDQQEWSIGYKVPPGQATRDRMTGVRHIKSLDLFEYSPVLVGTMPLAFTTDVKSAQAAWQDGAGEGYDPESDPEFKSAEGMEMSHEDMLDLLGEMLPKLVELQGWLTQTVKRRTEEDIEADRREQYDNPVQPQRPQRKSADDFELIDLDDNLNDHADDADLAVVELRDGTTQVGGTLTDVLDEPWSEGKSLAELTDNVLTGTDLAVKSDTGQGQDGLIDIAEDIDAAISEDQLELFDEKAEQYVDLLTSAFEDATDDEKADLSVLAGALSSVIEYVEQKSPSRKERDKSTEKGHAMSDGSFPIENVSDLRKAVSSFGRAKDQDAAKKHIIKRARDLGATDKLPVWWGVKESKGDESGETGTVTLDLAAMGIPLELLPK